VALPAGTNPVSNGLAGRPDAPVGAPTAGQRTGALRGDAAQAVACVPGAVPVVAPHASRAGLSAFHGELREAPAPGWSRPGTRSDVGGHISTEPRINDRIRVPEVRLVGPSGEQVGIVSITDALRLAQEADLDLVEVAPTARPPVAKLMDFGKFKYESALKARESRKNQAQTVIKEIKIRPKIDPHDYGTKKGHVERFLRQGDKVKVTIMFRGREQSRPELGYKLLQRLAGDVEELGFVESQPKQDGRNMIMVIGPHRKKTDVKAVRAQDRASARATAPAAGHHDQAAAAAPRAASARPASRQATAEAPSGTQSPGSQGPQPRPGAAPAGPRPGPGSAPSQTAASSQVTPRPAAPRPGPPAEGPRPTAPKPGPTGGGSRPATPKPGPTGGAARPAAPRPSAPRPQAGRPGGASPVTAPSARPAKQGAAGAEAGG
jgi:translation initiation factor IF-3